MFFGEGRIAQMSNENVNAKQITNRVGDVGALVICFVLVYFIGSLLNAWKVDPIVPGIDSFNHLYKTNYVLKYWSHDEWNYQWSGGMPQFLWYPPLFYYV